MKVLALNIRATQGGAGRVGYDLHHRLGNLGVQSRLLYGYGSGIKPDPNAAGDSSVTMFGSRPVVLANYATHWLIGRELFTANQPVLKQAVAWADVVHIHAPHHYYMNWHTLLQTLRDAGKPVVITAHDWWLVSGRCGFARDCTGWQRGCGECGQRRFEDLPSLFDRSASVRNARHAALETISDQLTIACPSGHLANDHRMALADYDIRVVPNALDREFEAMLDVERPEGSRSGIVFCAADLASPGKIDASLVRAMAAELGEQVQLAGRASPFGDTAATWLGEIRDRKRMAEIFSTVRALIFTSQMDNAPLTIIEALSSGAYVVAYDSPAAAEMLKLVGGRCVASPDEARVLVRKGREAELFGGQSHSELVARARQVWSGDAMARAYLDLYHELTNTKNGETA